MKRIINGKRYNTETAEELHNWSNGLGGSDFRNRDESLYRTKNGAYFLSGEGGPMTQWSQACGNMTSGGEGIIPMTDAEARRWLEEHDGHDALETHFGSTIPDA